MIENHIVDILDMIVADMIIEAVIETQVVVVGTLDREVVILEKRGY